MSVWENVMEGNDLDVCGGSYLLEDSWEENVIVLGRYFNGLCLSCEVGIDA